MERIVIRLTTAPRSKISLEEFPDLESSKKIIRRGIELLHQHAPRLLHFLSHQHAYSRLADFPLLVLAPAGLDEAAVRDCLQKWLDGKKYRRLLYIVIELAFMPLALLAGVLPGPNVFFYSLIILFYFHIKAFIVLRKVKAKDLHLQINPD